MTADPNSNDPRFVQYYANESATDRARERAKGIMAAVLRARRRAGSSTEDLLVADIGCNAGTQSRVWLDAGHRAKGIDISRDLVALAVQRSGEYGSRASYEVGSATALPWPDSTFDVSLLPELLEHVEDWEPCVREAVRVLKPGGTIFLSTTNVLCPIQQEFTLPLYSWYPAWIKRRVLRRATTDRPELANFATYPAVHWFSPYGLKRFLSGLSVDSYDRFDLIDLANRGAMATGIVRAIQALPPLRFAGHVCTSGTLLVGFRRN